MTTSTVTTHRDGANHIVQASGEQSATTAWGPIPAYQSPLDALYVGSQHWAAQNLKDVDRLQSSAVLESAQGHVITHIRSPWQALRSAVADGRDAGERRNLNIAGFIPENLPFGADDRARFASLPLGEKVRFIHDGTLDELAAVAAGGQVRSGLDDGTWAKLVERLELKNIMAKQGLPAQFPAAVTLDNLTGRGFDRKAAEAAAQAQIDAAREVDRQAVRAERVLADTVNVVAAATGLRPDGALALLMGTDGDA